MRDYVQTQLDAKEQEYRATQATLRQLQQSTEQVTAALLRLEGAIVTLRGLLTEAPAERGAEEDDMPRLGERVNGSVPA